MEASDNQAAQLDESAVEHTCIKCEDTEAAEEPDNSSSAGISSAYYAFGSARMIIMVLGTLLLAWAFCWLYLGTSWDPQVSADVRSLAACNARLPTHMSFPLGLHRISSVLVHL